jgi:hypothetical protein
VPLQQNSGEKMTYYDNNNKGTLWPTKNFKDDEAKCHYSGSCKIDEDEFQLFGRREGKEREFSICADTGEGFDTLARVTMKPVKNPEKIETWPLFRGEFEFNDNNLEVAAWGREVMVKGNKKKILNLVFKPKQQPNTEPPAPDDEVPF